MCSSDLHEHAIDRLFGASLRQLCGSNTIERVKIDAGSQLMVEQQDQLKGNSDHGNEPNV